ncbi:ribonuclease H-like domain-containing protein [Tanacetum coccineum]
MLRSDASYARGHTTQRTVHSKKRGKLLKKLTTYSLVHSINLEDNTEQQGQDSTNATAKTLSSIKTLEIQIGQMSKVLQERGFGSLPNSMEMNPRDHVKSISTAKDDSTGIHRIGSGPYAKEAREVKILETYDYTLPQKEKDPVSFTLPCFIHNVCFDKALVDLGASVGVMPFSTYTNLGLGDLAHTRLNIELDDRTIKYPRGIAENVLVRIGFSIIDDMDITSGVVLGMPFCKKFMSRQKIMEKFAHEDECEEWMKNEKEKKKSNLKTR